MLSTFNINKVDHGDIHINGNATNIEQNVDVNVERKSRLSKLLKLCNSIK